MVTELPRVGNQRLMFLWWVFDNILHIKILEKLVTMRAKSAIQLLKCIQKWSFFLESNTSDKNRHYTIKEPLLSI